MSAQLESVPDAGTLFDPAPFIASRIAMGFRGAGNLGISNDEASYLRDHDGKDEVLEFRVFGKVKGYLKEGDTVVYNIATMDASVVLD